MFLFFRRNFWLLRLRLFTGEHFLQRTEEAAQQTWFSRLITGFSRFLHSGFCRRFFLNRSWWGFWHDEGRQRRLFWQLALGRFCIRRHRHLFFMQFWQQVAQGAGLFAFAHAQDGVVRGLHLIVWYDDAAHAALTGFNGTHRFTFFVQQVGGNWHRNNGVNLFGILFQCFFFDEAQNREGERFVVAHGTRTATARTDVVA
ncbi:hypothetical protein D3C72_1104440 [compost metagenome]